MDILLEEYVGAFEEVQGNVNVVGLVFESDIDEALGVDHEVYLVWIEQIEDGLAAESGLEPVHDLLVTENIGLTETMGGIPVEVYQSNVTVISAREAAPVRVGWFGVNVVHGADTFFEEVYSGLHCRISMAKAVPYYWETVYESFDMEWHNILPHPGITLSRAIPAFDFVNMRHVTTPEFYFNNLVKESKMYSFDRIYLCFEAVLDADKAIKGFSKLEPHDVLVMFLRRVS
jgi:hypothetical protein